MFNTTKSVRFNLKFKTCGGKLVKYSNEEETVDGECENVLTGFVMEFITNIEDNQKRKKMKDLIKKRT
jgi:hypothetical protein